MKKILVLTTSLGQGGITSFLIPLLNLLSELGNEVTLAYTKDHGEYLSRLSSKIKYLHYDSLDKRKTIQEWMKKFAFYDMARVFFRRSNRKPHYPSIQRLNYIKANSMISLQGDYDVAISSAEGFCNAMIATKVNAKRKIGWVHPDMSAIGLDTKRAQPILDKLDKIVAVSAEGYNSLINFFPKDYSKIVHIDNIIDVSHIVHNGNKPISDVSFDKEFINIVTVCRIANESKRLDRIVKVSDILKKNKCKFKWYIIGDGPDTSIINKLIIDRGLQESIIMLGGRNNPLPYIKQADCFVLSSQFEGKPVVVEEAKVLHTPVIVTNYSSAKIQVSPEVGVVVSNKDGLLEMEIANVLMNKELLRNLQATCKSFVYNNDRSVELIKSIL